jgi:hypothetical protein
MTGTCLLEVSYLKNPTQFLCRLQEASVLPIRFVTLVTLVALVTVVAVVALCYPLHRWTNYYSLPASFCFVPERSLMPGGTFTGPVVGSSSIVVSSSREVPFTLALDPFERVENT